MSGEAEQLEMFEEGDELNSAEARRARHEEARRAREEAKIEPLTGKRKGRAPRDLRGQVFGGITAIGPTEARSYNDIVWRCICECGREAWAARGNIVKGWFTHCGCRGGKKRRAAPGTLGLNPDGTGKHGGTGELSEKAKANNRVAVARWSAEADRGHEYRLSSTRHKEIIARSCRYCGRPARTAPRGTNGIDRVDSSQGYVEGNVVPCCKRCNRMKNDLPLDVWLDHMARVLEHMRHGRAA